MNEEMATSTLERIHMAAKQEFMEKGFQSASLRNILMTAVSDDTMMQLILHSGLGGAFRCEVWKTIISLQ